MLNNHEQLSKLLDIIVRTNQVPFIKGPPGIGKSSLVYALAKKYGLYVYDLTPAAMQPEDFNGLPTFNEKGQAQYSEFVNCFPMADTPIPEGYNGFLLFLDEFNSNEEVFAATYKLLLNKTVNNKPLHPNTFIILAGNNEDDKGIVFPLPTPLKTRVITLQYMPTMTELIKNVLIPQGWHEKVIAYWETFPDSYLEFDPNKDQDTYSVPRTWEMASDLAKVIERTGKIGDEHISLFEGTIAHGASFVAFCKATENIPSVQQIVDNPNLSPPSDRSLSYATCISLSQNVEPKDYKAVFAYIQKMPNPTQVIFFRSLRAKNPKVINNSEFLAASSAIGNYFS